MEDYLHIKLRGIHAKSENGICKTSPITYDFCYNPQEFLRYIEERGGVTIEEVMNDLNITGVVATFFIADFISYECVKPDETKGKKRFILTARGRENIENKKLAGEIRILERNPDLRKKIRDEKSSV